MTFPHLNRRVHLYLALGLLPWFFMYGLSSAAFSHSEYFEARDKASGVPLWKTRFEQPYEAPVPEGDLKAWGERIAAEHGLTGNVGVYRQSPTQVNIYVYTFSKSTQIKYLIDQKKLVAEDRRFRWDHYLTGMHGQGGFENGGFYDVWAVIVDLVCLGMVLWVVSGLVMWWGLPQTRGWGWLALLGGVASFAVFVARL